MSYLNSEAVEKELEAVIFTNTKDLQTLHNLCKCYRARFQFVNSYKKLFDEILNKVVEQASLGYTTAERGHSFKRFTRLLVAQTLATNIRYAGQIGTRRNLRAFMDE